MVRWILRWWIREWVGFVLQYFGGLVCSSMNASIILNPDIGRLWLIEGKPSSTATSDWL